MAKAPLHSSGDASRLTALFVGYICPICALLTLVRRAPRRSPCNAEFTTGCERNPTAPGLGRPPWRAATGPPWRRQQCISRMGTPGGRGGGRRRGRPAETQLRPAEGSAATSTSRRCSRSSRSRSTSRSSTSRETSYSACTQSTMTAGVARSSIPEIPLAREGRLDPVVPPRRPAVADAGTTHQGTKGIPEREAAQRHLQRLLPPVELAPQLHQLSSAQQLGEVYRLLVLAQDDGLGTDAAQKHWHATSLHEPRVPLVHAEEHRRPMRLFPVLHGLRKPAERMMDIAVDVVPLELDGPLDLCRPLPFVAERRLAEHDGDGRQPGSAAQSGRHARDGGRVEPTREIRPDRIGSGRPARHGLGEGAAELLDVVFLPAVNATARSTPLPVTARSERACAPPQPMARLEPRQPAIGRTARVRTIHTQGKSLRDVLHVERRRLPAERPQLAEMRGETHQVVPHEHVDRPHAERVSGAEEAAGALVTQPEREVTDQPRRARNPPGAVGREGQPGIVGRGIDAPARQLPNQLPAVVDPAVEHHHAASTSVSRCRRHGRTDREPSGGGRTRETDGTSHPMASATRDHEPRGLVHAHEIPPRDWPAVQRPYAGDHAEGRPHHRNQWPPRHSGRPSARRLAAETGW